MNKLIILGAINKKTNQYESPDYAIKTNNYECPDCLKNVILRKGEINRPHFSHKSKNNSCNYYDNPSESQIHKNAKIILKTILENNNCEVIKTCKNCNNCESVLIPKYDDNKEIKLEYNFKYNDINRFADIAYINNINEEIIAIFEIYYKHQTNEFTRPEPWYEINAIDILEEYNQNFKNTNINVKCNRNYICQKCKDTIIYFFDGDMDYRPILQSLFFDKNILKTFFIWFNSFNLNYLYNNNKININIKCLLKHNKLFFNLLDSREKIIKKNFYIFKKLSKDDENIFFDNLKIFLNNLDNGNYSNLVLNNSLTGFKIKFNFEISKKIIEHNYIDFIEKIEINKGNITVFFNKNYGVLNENENEKIEIITNIVMFWSFTCGEYDSHTFADENGDYITEYEYTKFVIYYDVDFKNKDEIKKLNGKWNNEKKKWYIEDNKFNQKFISKANELFNHKNGKIYGF